MIRSPLKLFGVLLLTLAAFVFSASTASTKDILEFIDIPEDDVQAMMDPMLACTNGVSFEFHAVDKQASRPDGPHKWDISFANEAGDLIIQEYPLWLAEAEAPLHRNGRIYPYTGVFTLLWNEPVPAAPLTTCVSGAGSGFCEFQLPIDDCQINPSLVADIAQIGPEDTTPRVSDALVFEVRAYDPAVGTANGDGIQMVEMQILDPDDGAAVFSTELVTESPLETAVETEVVYCAFAEDCAPWVFSEHNYTWPGGDPVRSGPYLLRAIVSTPDNMRTVAQTQIEVDVPLALETVHVPAGDFTMGSDTGSENEQPVHDVSLDDFWIMRTEVTNRQYAQCVKAGACTKPKDDERWRDPAYADHPVTSIDWDQANDFAAWVGGRLPTEAEWEKACRSTDGRTYPWGEALPTAEVANYNNLLADTTPVGTYPVGASPYGALDMSGNTWEWTSSLDAGYPYEAGDGREDAEAGGRRIVRGGSFYYTQYQLTCTTRSPVSTDVINPQNGMRVVFDQPRDGERVRFAAPADGATVPPVFEVGMAATGLTVEPAGEIHEGAGHFHILLDTDFVLPEELIPFDENHLHFGQGQITTTLELEPGEHVLRLQFANGAHQALEGDQYRDEITVIVESE
jgi:formylglycine-generating enzyme required for sulfatase activity